MVSGSGALISQTLFPAYQLVAAQVAAVNTALSDGAVIQSGSFVMFDPAIGTNSQFSIQAGGLSADESAEVFQTMLTILEARQTALAAELATVS